MILQFLFKKVRSKMSKFCQLCQIGNYQNCRFFNYSITEYPKHGDGTSIYQNICNKKVGVKCAGPFACIVRPSVLVDKGLALNHNFCLGIISFSKFQMKNYQSMPLVWPILCVEVVQILQVLLLIIQCFSTSPSSGCT